MPHPFRDARHSATVTPCRSVLTLCALLLLSACASKAPDFGDRLIGQGGDLSALGEQWQEGQDLVRKGRKLIAKGEEEIADGRRHVAEGESMMDRGLQLIERSEREYRVLEQLRASPSAQ